MGALQQGTYIYHVLKPGKSKIKVLADAAAGENLHPDLRRAAFLLYPHMTGTVIVFLYLLLQKVTNPVTRAPSSSSNYLRKAPPRGTIPLGVRVSTCEPGDMNIQSMAGALLESHSEKQKGFEGGPLLVLFPLLIFWDCRERKTRNDLLHPPVHGSPRGQWFPQGSAFHCHVQQNTKTTRVTRPARRG